MMTAAALSRAICTIADLGVADQIERGKPQSVSTLAEQTGAHERSLHRTLRFLSGYGLFEETSRGHFDHTDLSAALRADAPGSYRPAALMFHNFFPAWDGLDHAVRTGRSGLEKLFGKPPFEYMAEHPELGPVFDAAMTSIHGYETGAMLDAYDFSGISTLADIGGGNGSLIAGVLARYPKMNGLLFDLGHVMGRAKESIAKRGLADRCRIVEGSFLDTVPTGADAYLMRHIIHDWNDEDSIRILKNCRKAVPANGRLLLVECVVPENNKPSIARDFDMTMMTLPGGIERTEAEYRDLYEASGFRLTSITPTTTMVSVLEGRPV